MCWVFMGIRSLRDGELMLPREPRNTLVPIPMAIDERLPTFRINSEDKELDPTH